MRPGVWHEATSVQLYCCQTYVQTIAPWRGQLRVQVEANTEAEAEEDSHKRKWINHSTNIMAIKSFLQAPHAIPGNPRKWSRKNRAPWCRILGRVASVHSTHLLLGRNRI